MSRSSSLRACTPKRSWASPLRLSNTEALVEELKSLVADVLDRFPKLEEVLKSSLVSPEQKEAVAGSRIQQSCFDPRD